MAHRFDQGSDRAPMRRICLLLLVAVLVGLANEGTGLQQLGQRLEALVVPQIQALSPSLAGTYAGLLEWPVLTDLGRAAATSLLTIVLGVAFLRLPWWVGLLGLVALSAAWCALALIAAPVAPGPVLLPALVGYGFGLFGHRPDRPDPDRNAERRASNQDLLMPMLAASSRAAILTFDRDGLIRSCNRAAEAMFDYARHELLGTPFRQLLAGPERDRLQLAARADGTSCELGARRRDGQCLDLAAALSVLDLDDGRVRVAILQDITKLQAPRQARPLHDTVTGLPQDVLLADRVDQAILAAERADQPLALLIIHLKMLQTIRETLGDGFADQLLGRIVGRLRASLRRSDTVARIGDAELGLLLPCPTDGEAAGRKAEAIASQLDQPLVVEGLEARLEVHIGLATYPRNGRTTHELRQRAEVAMLAARRTQRAVVAYAEAGSIPVAEQQLLVDQLRAAIEDGQLFLEFSPKLDLRTGRLDGVEALVRWQHPERSVIPAERFIGIAERHGLILPLTLRVIALAIGQQRTWQDQGKALSVAINLSVELLQDPQFPLIFERVCTATGGRAGQLLLEISERTLAEHSTTIVHVSKTLKEMGCQLSLDNFGTGSLSLPLLQRLPIVELKIDRSFVTGMARDESAAAVVRSAMSLAESLGLRVVAVGVEDHTTLDKLGELGCTQAQGYYIGPPMTAAKFQEWAPTLPEAGGRRWSAEPDAA